MKTEEILARLIAFPSVVGTANHDIVDWIRTYLTGLGAQVSVLPGPEGDRSNLFASIGPADQRGIILSGHMDVVPAAEPPWSSDPFSLRREGERLYGRGTSDMKGFLACALAALPTLASLPLSRPLHLAFSYDEEAGCRGVPHLISRLPDLCAKPQGCIVGEPSGLRAIRAHKGKAAARIEIVGRAGHSSRPDLGLNAIHAMAEIVAEAVCSADALTKGPFDGNFEPPYSSLQVGTIAGGQAVNIIPERCTIELEARAVAGVDPSSLLSDIETKLESLTERGFKTRWETLSAYPALSLKENAPLAVLLRDLTGQEPLPAVSYGTEAGLYQAAGIDAIICGPGDIARAHKANEYIESGELAACRTMIEALGQRLRA
ncbi:acetylornithine deacetylase [Sinorhizobium americanum]|uniref:Acetylornithine deacetylase ArgE n=1 Tax=Sinorhizobium americanum TaxID=194963 RepID=A0A1L3LW95_9HYPH|nr:acetylornithine deacetylase [Sinorhizobium americanum]APG94370.1 acetylornithine deacetylase ArgE [Sinorhizobium americanum]OAP44448.1 acetylornithine deacetylase [Sinorhizobium americanum]